MYYLLAGFFSSRYYRDMKLPSPTIYLDYASATPLLPEVQAAMQPFYSDLFYNPSSLHQGGVKVRLALEEARSSIAQHISARADDIIFFDGGTEANNMAVQSLLTQWKREHPHKRPKMITTHIEHSSLSALFKKIKQQVDVVYLDVNKEGRVDPKHIRDELDEKIILVSLPYANGEIGVVQDLKEIARVIRRFRKLHKTVYPRFHTDAVQSLNHLNINVLQLGVDLMTIAASKIYGPKKIAALYVKPDVTLDPMLYGGQQERGLRPGTENVASIVGFAKALTIVRSDAAQERTRLRALALALKDKLIEHIPNVIINSPLSEIDLPHIVNISIPHLSSEEILVRLDAQGIACSMKSACQSGEEGDSETIIALRGTHGKHTQSLRFSLGRMTTSTEINQTSIILKNIIETMYKTKNTLSS